MAAEDAASSAAKEWDDIGQLLDSGPLEFLAGTQSQVDKLNDESPRIWEKRETDAQHWRPDMDGTFVGWALCQLV